MFDKTFPVAPAIFLAGLGLASIVVHAQDSPGGRVQVQGTDEARNAPRAASAAIPGGVVEPTRPALRCFQRGVKVLEEETDGGAYALQSSLLEMRLKNGSAIILLAAGEGGFCAITAHRGTAVTRDPKDR